MMKKELKMRFRKVRTLSTGANSDRTLILRQQFALEFLNLVQAGKTIINIDETWLGMSDFRHTKWCLPNESNTFPKLKIQPRISMIAALDSNGLARLTLL